MTIAMRLFPVLFFVICTLSSAAQDKSLPEIIQLHARETDPARVDYRGFTFLDTMLQNKRIVLLGESSHGTEEYSETKMRLIQYLHEKLGYKVVLFESPMTNVSYANITTDTTGKELVKNSIQSVWHTATVSRLFGYIKSEHMQLGGFDPQYMHTPYPALFYSNTLKGHPALLYAFLQLEKRVGATIKTPPVYLSIKDSLSTAYAQLAQHMSAIPPSPMLQWIQQIATTNSRYYENLTKGDERDKCMANNIIWLAENMYPNEKIIVWAHNTHIDKNPSNNRIMGKLLAEHFKDQLYGIGLFMVNGTTALNDGKIITVKEAPKGSLEKLVAARGFRAAYLETNYPAFDKRITTLHWGKDKQVLNLHKSFDAVMVINGVQAVAYIRD